MTLQEKEESHCWLGLTHLSCVVLWGKKHKRQTDVRVDYQRPQLSLKAPSSTDSLIIISGHQELRWSVLQIP